MEDESILYSARVKIPFRVMLDAGPKTVQRTFAYSKNPPVPACNSRVRVRVRAIVRFRARVRVSSRF